MDPTGLRKSASGAGRGRDLVRPRFTGDVWTDAKLLQAEELMVEAREVAARRALLRGIRPPGRGVRNWIGAVLLAAGRRVLGSFAGQEPGTSESADRSDRKRSACPVCRSLELEASSGQRAR